MWKRCSRINDGEVAVKDQLIMDVDQSIGRKIVDDRLEIAMVAENCSM
jgi:hypothetical protein